MGQSKTILPSIAILSIFFLQQGVSILTPAIQNIAQAFPEIPLTTLMLVSTLPSLTMVLSSICSGAMAERYGYRLISIIGILLFIIGGTLPYIQENFIIILISRGFFGLSIGVVFPMGNALVLKFYEGQKRANMMGIANVSSNLGGIVMQMGGAFLCTISWRYTFLAHLIGVVMLFFVFFFLPEPEKIPVRKTTRKIKLPDIVWILSILCGLMWMLAGPMLLNMSTIVIESKLGTAAGAGVVLSMFTGGGMISGAIFGKVFKVFGRFVIGIAIAFLSMGLGIVNFAGTLPFLGIGAAAIGMGIFLFMPASMMEFGMKVEPEGIAMSTGIFMGLANFGLFLTPYYIALLAKSTGNADIRFPILVGMFIAFTTALVVTIARLNNKPSLETYN